MSFSEYENLDPNQITGVGYEFRSQWHIDKCLAWLDHIKRTNQHNCLRYAAIELRYGIELLWFEILVVSGFLSDCEYKSCITKATRMYKKIDELYEKRMEFMEILASLDPNYPEIAVWDLKKLTRFHGEASQFLHFQGNPKDTFKDPNWLEEGIAKLENMATYIWKFKTASTANMKDEQMKPATRAVWKRFEAGEMDADAA